MVKTLYVGNLSWQTTEDDLRGLFEKEGELESVRLITDRNTGRSKGFAFVETSDDLAQKLIDSYNGFEFNGRKIIVSEARPRTERSSAPRYRKF
ncbi:MAG TPA: RNA-binding protein [Dictyoglomaceae bacterium]|nr:RNA-binding protein [Dictyoglomaceae bacterium]HOL39592.1 RNA-binding protein [Dictyoglomaceae bacterium]HOP94952.1 RNA-binding protein [Dictyoglomaceae bacterium]HPP16524.1 RNA-binding protein [Dictyoglomaceae bacterium]